MSFHGNIVLLKKTIFTSIIECGSTKREKIIEKEFNKTYTEEDICSILLDKCPH